MAEPWLDVVEKVTEFFATAQIEAVCAAHGVCPAHVEDHGQGVSGLGDSGGLEYSQDLLSATGGQSGAVAQRRSTSRLKPCTNG